MDLATALAAAILALAPVVAILEWRLLRRNRKLIREVSEMLDRHQEWLCRVLPPEEEG